VKGSGRIELPLRVVTDLGDGAVPSVTVQASVTDATLTADRGPTPVAPAAQVGPAGRAKVPTIAGEPATAGSDDAAIAKPR
jgi:hypothetical protein